MGATDRDGPLSGLAGSIDALFAKVERSEDGSIPEPDAAETVPGPAAGGVVAIADLAPEGEPGEGEAVDTRARAPGPEVVREVVGIEELAPRREAPEAAGMEAPGPSPGVVDIEELAPVGEAPAREASGEASVEPVAVQPGAEAAALPVAVEEYLTAGDARRDALGRRIRDLAAALAERDEVGPVADAVERLIIAGRRNDREPQVTLGRTLATPMVVGVLTGRLAAARDEPRRGQLVEVAAALRERMASTVGDALSNTEDRSARRAYTDALVAMGDGASEVVAAMIDDARWYVVRNAVLILGETGGEPSVQHLTRTLAHENPRVRRETVLALARIGGEDAGVLVRNEVDDEDPHVRAAAALAVGELRPQRAERVLAGRLEEEDVEEVQIALIRALGRVGDPGSVPVLEKRTVGRFFFRPPTEVRVAAYRALGAIGTPHARKVLTDAIDDRDPAVRAAAQAALEG